MIRLAQMIRAVVGGTLLLAVLAAAQSSPLIMKHADSLAVARTYGTLLLQGRVHFVHDTIQFRTQRASWNKNTEVVQCDGGFLFTHPSGSIQAQTGMYNKKKEVATATGDVKAADSAGSYMFTGEHLIYDRKQEILTMPDKPKLFQFEHQKDSTIDTVTIEAKRIVYNKKESFAEAFNSVKVTQKDMVVTCDTGYFDRKNNWLSMKGHPTCDMKNYHLTGDSLFLVLDESDKSLKSALVIRNAHGVQQEDAKKGSPGSVTEAFGDTLYCEFANNKIERLYVNLNAKGFFYETDLPDYRNLMDGNRLDLYFKKGKMDYAVVSGKAQSTYFYVKKDRSVAGKNEAAGDTINIVFDAQKNAVKSLKLLGNSTMASGRYIDLEKENRNKALKEAAKQDSIAALQKEGGTVATLDKKGTEKANIEMSDEEKKKKAQKALHAFELRKRMKDMAEKKKAADGQTQKTDETTPVKNDKNAKKETEKK
ncbi:hypothetical protein [Fibrobacter sp. UWP2]|uniref:hypothetical protein n=1 Tax=Fibrobacter sp. UWP2 TaxID=1896216 RepID=UPI000910222F|nr:hypothetical protein [Fibrobacter sp. UWP2]SHJ06339.1 hypothetical protein SAMN05720471_11554 [Fibrobacter sp. UWP2]